LFPISDDNPRVRFPLATVAIIVLNALVWVGMQGLGQDQALAASLCHYALIPGELLGHASAGTTLPVGHGLVCELPGTPRPITIFTSMFMHGGWFHIIGNMWFLWVFGDNVEDEMGSIRFSLFYLLCGLAAAVSQMVVNPTSLIPMVGASGAIGGVMGAYALLFPRVRVRLLVILGVYVTTFAVPAIYMLGYWFLLQLVQGFVTIGTDEGGVAFWAHMGGFAAGLGLVWVFRRRARTSRSDGRWF
jgi:membrane associated rhomboid family serine protease